MKGVRDALLEKLKKSDLKIEDRKVTKIAEEIEIAMFGKYFSAFVVIFFIFYSCQALLEMLDLNTRTNTGV